MKSLELTFEEHNIESLNLKFCQSFVVKSCFIFTRTME